MNTHLGVDIVSAVLQYFLHYRLLGHKENKTMSRPEGSVFVLSPLPAAFVGGQYGERCRYCHNSLEETKCML